jgi:hypothetical protein
MRSDIIPTKRVEKDNTNNLDLNTTARQSEKIENKASPYLVNESYAVVIAKLARPIDNFNEEQELKIAKEKIAEERKR